MPKNACKQGQSPALRHSASSEASKPVRSAGDKIGEHCMAYWLVKSEPGEFSWDQQVKAGKKGTPWTGVRAHPAKLNLMKMAKGDKAFFYHTGDEKQIVGIVEIAKTAYPDPTAEKDAPWVVVDTVAAEPLKT